MAGSELQLIQVELREVNEPVSILIVDDQTENLVALEAVLADLGQNIVKAHSGKEALKCLLDQDFAIILLDIKMPEMDGFQTAALIRQRDRSSHTPIIFLSAMYTEDMHASQAYSLGAVDFITKPFVPEFLKSKVGVFVELARKNQAIRNQADIIREIERKRMGEEQERLQAEKLFMEEELKRKEAEQELLKEKSLQLQKADRLKDEFLANVSHEIRTPMSAVIGFAELMLHTELSDEQRDFANTIKDSAEALLILINDILDLSKVEAGKLDLEHVEFEIRPLVEGTANFLSRVARSKGLSVMTYVDPGVPGTVRGDPGRVRQILLNLIGNAIKFTEQGEVTVKVRPADGDGAGGDRFAVQFNITDTGIGMNDEEMNRLFRPFTQADGSTTRRYGGTGLGLSICKRLVELMGGEIGVDSVHAEGSTFFFRVPFEVAQQEAPADTITLDISGARILAVDDHASARTILRSYIASWNVHCDAIEDPAEALVHMEKTAREGKPYDVVLVDLVMPGINGFDFVRKVKADINQRNTKVILCTAHDTMGQGEEALREGFSAYLIKPIDQSRLYNSIAQVLMDRKMELGSVHSESTSLRIAPASSETSQTILLVEDNPVNQKVAKLQLAKIGFACAIVSNGKEALDELARQSYGLILMDCQMPEMDGFEATRQIRKAETMTGRHIPIVGLTAHAMEGDREKCLAAGMDEYLTKPCSLIKMSQTLKRWMPDTQVSTSIDGKHLNDLGRVVSDLKLAVDEREIDEVRNVAVSLQKASADCGASRMTALGLMLEQATQSADWSKITSLYAELEESFQEVRRLVTI